MNVGRNALAASISDNPRNRTSLTSLSCRVWLARSTRPLACGVFVDGFDIKSFEGPCQLGQFPLPVGPVDPENTVLVRVEGDGPPMALQRVPYGLHTRLGGLGGRET